VAVTAYLIAAAAAVAAYWAGRTRPGRRVFAWAEDRADGAHGPGWWAAQAVGLVALAWMLAAHPRRSAANRRSWREARNVKRSPAPRFDPDWAARRSRTTTEETSTHG
jgi:hypothetical protein